MDANPRLGSGRRVNIAAVLFGARFQAKRGRVGVVDIDARHARRMRHRHCVSCRSDRAGNDAILERRRHGVEREAEPPCPVAHHWRLAPTVALGGLDLHQRRYRRAVPGEAGLDGKRGARFHACIARDDVEPDVLGKQHQRGGVVRLTPRNAAGEHHGRQDDRGGGRLQSGAADRLGWNNSVEVDRACLGGCICQHRLRNRGRGRLPVRTHDVDRADQTVVERRRALFNESRDAEIGRRVAKWHGGPGNRAERQHARDHARDRQGDGRTIGPLRDKQCSDQHPGRCQRAANCGLEQRQRAPAGSDPRNQLANGLIMSIHFEFL